MRVFAAVATLLAASVLGLGCSRRLAPDGSMPDSAANRVREIVESAVASEGAGAIEHAIELRASAAQTAEGAGLHAEAARLHMSLVFLNLYRRRNIAEATLHLQAASALSAGPREQAQLAYSEGLLARERGDTGTALRAFDIARERALRAAMPRDAFAAAHFRASLLAEIGRLDEALSSDAALASQAKTQIPCDRANYLNDYAWLEILKAESTGEPSSLPHAEALLAGALALYQSQCTSDRASLAIALCNQSYSALLAGRLDQVALRLAALDALGTQVPTHVELWRLDIEARLLDARGDARASLAAYQRLDALAASTLASEARWRSLVGQGRALSRLKRTGESVTVFQDAEDLLDDAILALPLGEGRTGLASLRDASAVGLVEGLLRLGRKREAFTVVRRARIRALEGLDRQSRLATLAPSGRQAWDAAISRFLDLRERLDRDARNTWSLAGDKLATAKQDQLDLARDARRALQDAMDASAAGRPPRLGQPARGDASTIERRHDGELVLAYFALAEESWLGFAQLNGELSVRRMGRIAGLSERGPSQHPDEAGRRLIEPFAASIGRARSVRVLSSGVIDAIDFHALPFRGRPLLASRNVVYGLDLPTAADESGPGANRLLVADPAGNLPGARAEAAAIVPRWSALGAAITVMSGPEATRARVLRAIETADVFHYAGHGRFGGVEGLGSELPLADGASLSVGDILSLSKSPARAVLLGCETARAASAGRRGGPAGLGFGQAFVLAGSQEVIAAERPVDDQLALALAQELYVSSGTSLTDAYRKGLLTVRAHHPRSDWAAFRVLVP